MTDTNRNLAELDAEIIAAFDALEGARDRTAYGSRTDRYNAIGVARDRYRCALNAKLAFLKMARKAG